MCRMFGLVAAQAVDARALLRDAPRSLWALSREHPDGWGVALHDDASWRVHRSTACAQASAEFDALAAAARARVMLAHVRQKTVGETRLVNTHPFLRGGVAFAHNGTLTAGALATLRARTAPARLAEVEGDTDSERLFAFLATRLDEAPEPELGLIAAVQELHAIADLGAANFLLSCGRRLYAHRLGRTMHVLARHGAGRTTSLTVASEALTDEPWDELPERSLWVLESADAPSVRRLV